MTGRRLAGFPAVPLAVLGNKLLFAAAEPNEACFTGELPPARLAVEGFTVAGVTGVLTGPILARLGFCLLVTLVLIQSLGGPFRLVATLPKLRFVPRTDCWLRTGVGLASEAPGKDDFFDGSWSVDTPANLSL